MLKHLKMGYFFKVFYGACTDEWYNSVVTCIWRPARWSNSFVGVFCVINFFFFINLIYDQIHTLKAYPYHEMQSSVNSFWPKRSSSNYFISSPMLFHKCKNKLILFWMAPCASWWCLALGYSLLSIGLLWGNPLLPLLLSC